MAAAAASLYKGREKEINVREEHWFPRYYAVNADTLNNVARKNPTARIKMVGIQGDLKFGVRTKLEWTALQEDIQAQVLEGTITKRPEWLQVAFGDIKTALDWVDEGDGNRVLILCSCPARIGDDHKIMEQVDAMCQGNLKVEITFSKAGNAASNMFESGAVLGGGGAAQRQEYSDKLVAWFAALHISEAKTNEALHYLCGDEVGVVEVEDLALVDDASLEHAANILPPVRKAKFQKAIAVLKEGKTGKQPAPPPSLKPSRAAEEQPATKPPPLPSSSPAPPQPDPRSVQLLASSEARAAARAALGAQKWPKLDKELYDESNGSGNPGKVKDMLDRGADPNGYKVRRT